VVAVKLAIFIVLSVPRSVAMQCGASVGSCTNGMLDLFFARKIAEQLWSRCDSRVSICLSVSDCEMVLADGRWVRP
jgi:hypothetical protein